MNGFWHFFEKPRSGEVYNIGGGQNSNCFMLEASAFCEEIRGRWLNWPYSDENRIDDHIWYVSDVSKFNQHYPGWDYADTLRLTLEEIHQACVLQKPGRQALSQQIA